MVEHYALRCQNDGTHTFPKDRPAFVTDFNHISRGLQALGLIICGIIVGLELIFSYWAYRNCGLEVVCASQPMFLISHHFASIFYYLLMLNQIYLIFFGLVIVYNFFREPLCKAIVLPSGRYLCSSHHH